MPPNSSTSKHTTTSHDPSQDDSNSSGNASTTGRKVHVRTDTAAAAWRLCHTVWEGVVEAAWNLGNNTLELLPAWARPHSSNSEPYPEDLTGKVRLGHVPITRVASEAREGPLCLSLLLTRAPVRTGTGKCLMRRIGFPPDQQMN